MQQPVPKIEFLSINVTAYSNDTNLRMVLTSLLGPQQLHLSTTFRSDGSNLQSSLFLSTNELSVAADHVLYKYTDVDQSPLCQF